MIKLAIVGALLLGTAGSAIAGGWDPVGDITHPERIIRNVEREGSKAVKDIPNVPRNVVREGGKAIKDIPNVPRNVGNVFLDVGKRIDRLRLEAQAQALAPILEQWFNASRATALRGGVSPIPPAIRAQMKGLYNDGVLNRVRYKIGDSGVANLANVSIRYGDATAATLIDVVVFSNPAAAADPALWAHELKHVQQFGEWGVRDFAIRYLRSWNSVEDPAYEVQRNFKPRTADAAR